MAAPADRRRADGEGRRERKKQEKLERIRAAAEALFRERGFDGATIRDVAQRADVATGTVFLYAADKRELLFLVYRDGIARLAERAQRDMPGPEVPLVDRLMYCFGLLFDFYAADPELARHFIKEQLFPAGTPWELELRTLTRTFAEQLARFAADARVSGEVHAGVDRRQAAANFFALYLAALLSWLSGRVAADAALQGLRASLELQIAGLRVPPP